MMILQVICEPSKDQIDPKDDTDQPSPNAGMAATKIECCKINDSHRRRFNLMYHMPMLPILFKFLKNLEPPKEDTAKASPNAEMASRLIQISSKMIF